MSLESIPLWFLSYHICKMEVIYWKENDSSIYQNIVNENLSRYVLSIATFFLTADVLVYLYPIYVFEKIQLIALSEIE